MIEIRLKQLLEKRGRTLYWLAKATGCHYPSLWRLAESQVSRVTIDALDRICEALQCQPGDLLVKVESRKARKR